jgi:hypothetical protein
LIVQGRQVRQHPAAISDQHRRVGEHPATVVHRREPTPGKRPGQARGQAGAVGEDPHRGRAGVIDHATPTDFYRQIPRLASNIHLESAPRVTGQKASTPSSPGSGALSYVPTPPQIKIAANTQG